MSHADFDITEAFELSNKLSNEEINAWMSYMGDTFSKNLNIKGNTRDTLTSEDGIKKFNMSLPIHIPPVLNAAAILHRQTDRQTDTDNIHTDRPRQTETETETDRQRQTD